MIWLDFMTSHVSKSSITVGNCSQKDGSLFILADLVEISSQSGTRIRHKNPSVELLGWWSAMVSVAFA